jgi:uncharacterized membrane protein YuzA (DUF378 family)
MAASGKPRRTRVAGEMNPMHHRAGRLALAVWVILTVIFWPIGAVQLAHSLGIIDATTGEGSAFVSVLAVFGGIAGIVLMILASEPTREREGDR